MKPGPQSTEAIDERTLIPYSCAISMRGRKIMRRIFIGLALTLTALPAWAQSPNHKWVKAGTEQTMAGLYICVDQNRIVKGVDGRTQYEDTMNLNNTMTCEGGLESDISVENVNCNEDMSGENLMIAGQPYKKDGTYNWADRKEISVESTSMLGQSAKFVCHK